MNWYYFFSIGNRCCMTMAHICLSTYLNKLLRHQIISPPPSDVLLSPAMFLCTVNYWKMDVVLSKFLTGPFGGFSSWVSASLHTPPLPCPEFLTSVPKSCISPRLLTFQCWRAWWVSRSLDPFTCSHLTLFFPRYLAPLSQVFANEISASEVHQANSLKSDLLRFLG